MLAHLRRWQEEKEGAAVSCCAWRIIDVNAATATAPAARLL